MPAVPVAALAVVGEPGQAIREPRLRGIAAGERHHLGYRQGVAVVVQAAQARPCQSGLGDREEPPHGHLHGHAPAPQRARDAFHVRVRPRQYGNVTVAQRADVPGVRVDDTVAAGDEIGDALGERLEPVVEAAAGQGPAGYGGLVGGGVALGFQQDAPGIHGLPEGRRENRVHVVHQGRARTPVVLERDRGGSAGGEFLEGVEHQRLVAAAESEDGLLDVAHEDHAIGQRGELDEERELHRVRVLELVDQQHLEFVPEAVGDAPVGKRAQH